METAMTAPARQGGGDKEVKRNPLELLPLLMLVWIVVFVGIAYFYPEAVQAFGESLVDMFWTVVPRQVRP